MPQPRSRRAPPKKGRDRFRARCFTWRLTGVFLLTAAVNFGVHLVLSPSAVAPISVLSALAVETRDTSTMDLQRVLPAQSPSPPPAVGPKGTMSALGEGGREWPLVFLIGRQKAATTSLSQMMFDTHLFCRAYSSRGLAKKEVNFLHRPDNWARGLGWYLQHFGRDPRCPPPGTLPRNASQMLLRYVDATPANFLDPLALRHLKELLPEL